MAFSVSYSDSVNKNIKYMYHTQERSRMARKHATLYRPPPNPKGTPPRLMYPRRFFDYYPELGIGLPRAPAFRAVPKATVDSIIQRLSRPTLSRTDTLHKLCGTCQTCLTNQPQSRRYGFRKASPREVISIVSRLSQPSRSPRPFQVSAIGQEDGIPPVVV